MIPVLYFFYDYLILPLLFLFFKVSSLFNEKIKKGVIARNSLLEKIAEAKKNFSSSKKTVWFHSSSMGEFEQAKPLIEALRAKKDVNIAVTFFSPSGYENSKKYGNADLIAYIPFDTKKNCEKFLEILKPDAAIFMRYDIWPNMVCKLFEKNIPSFLVDATLSSDSMRKLPLAKAFHKHLYSRLTKILTVSEDDKKNFMEFDLPDSKVQSVGDTRFDRVYEKSLVAKDKHLFNEDIIDGKKVIVMGSSWEADEDVVVPALIRIIEEQENVLLIIAPHEPTEENIRNLESRFTDSCSTIKFSQIGNYKQEEVVIIDSIGILLSLYYYADIAYVGGSFKQGIHNVLEPAVYATPVIYGPKHKNSQEAVAMVKQGCGVVVETPQDAYTQFNSLLTDNELRERLGKISGGFVEAYTGATGKIIQGIFQELSN